MNVNLILMFLCAQIFLIHSYAINRIQKRHVWSDFDVEPTEEYLTKVLQRENLFNEANGPINAADQSDVHPRGVQKRGRQCLWKVCSWALDRRSPSAHSANDFSKLLY